MRRTQIRNIVIHNIYLNILFLISSHFLLFLYISGLAVHSHGRLYAYRFLHSLQVRKPTEQSAHIGFLFISSSSWWCFHVCCVCTCVQRVMINFKLNNDNLVILLVSLSVCLSLLHVLHLKLALKSTHLCFSIDIFKILYLLLDFACFKFGLPTHYDLIQNSVQKGILRLCDKLFQTWNIIS